MQNKSWSIIKRVIKNVLKCELDSNYQMEVIPQTVLSFPKNSMTILTNNGPTRSESIPAINMSPMYHMGNELKETPFLSPVDVTDITKSMMSLKNSASGYDDIKQLS